MSAVLPQADLPGELGAQIEARARADETFEPTVPAVLTSVQKLDLSRARLRTAMFPAPPAAPSPSAGIVAGWMSSLKALPGVDILIDALHAWWYRHPLKPMSDMAGDASSAAIRPIAQRHPFLLVLAAAGAGILIASLRPWRWALRSALFAGFLPQVLSRMVAKLPIESWLSMLSPAMAPRQTPRAPMPAERPLGPESTQP